MTEGKKTWRVYMTGQVQFEVLVDADDEDEAARIALAEAEYSFADEVLWEAPQIAQLLVPRRVPRWFVRHE